MVRGDRNSRERRDRGGEDKGKGIIRGDKGDIREDKDRRRGARDRGAEDRRDDKRRGRDKMG